MIGFLILQATLLSLVAGQTIYHNPVFYNRPLLQQPREAYSGVSYNQISWRSSEDEFLPCPGNGFFVHPTNCTRFYRCVDYASTGTLYSKYLYECPKGHVFLNAAQTCLPGLCRDVGTQLPVPQSPPQPGPPSGPVAHYPLPPPGPVTPSEPEPETIMPFTTEEPVTEGAAPGPCLNDYVQNPLYCNLYHPCNMQHIRYVCPTGTAFDEPRQMCRISAQDDDLCNGKSIFENTFLLRSEFTGSHVRLPDSYNIPSDFHQTQDVRRPVNRIVDFKTNSEFEAEPIFRPLIRRPAQIYRRPSVTFNTAEGNVFRGNVFPTEEESVEIRDPEHFNFNDPVFQRPLFSRPAQTRPTVFSDTRFTSDTRPLLKRGQTPASTRPLAEVRRPDEHLHFGSFYEHFRNLPNFR